MDVLPDVKIDYVGIYGVQDSVIWGVGSYICGALVLAIIVYVIVDYCRNRKKYAADWKELKSLPKQAQLAEQARQQRLVAAKREREQAVHQKFQREYEQRKQAIGRIVCPQCKWTGNWGDGMSYEEFFIYELVEVNKVRVSRRVDTNIHVLNSESQYKCPMCKSTNWQKV